MAATLPQPPLLGQNCLLSPSQSLFKSLLNHSLIIKREQRALVRCSAKKKLSFMDQILDYIEGGPKLRKWYGAPDLLEKDETGGDEDEDESSEPRDAVLVTNGDSEIGQMVILSLIVKRVRIKAMVSNKRAAMESFGDYVEAVSADTSDKSFLKKGLRGVRVIICPNEGFLSTVVGNLKGIQHIILLSQLSVYRGSSGIQALMRNDARKMAEQDESTLMASGIPYTIIRCGLLQNTPGGTQGFSFEKGSADKGSLSKEDAAFVCVAALDVVPQTGYVFEVVNGEEKVSDWKECLNKLMEKDQ